MSPSHKPLLFLSGEIKTPPFSEKGRAEAGFRLRQLQKGESLAMPLSRPMPSVGPRVHELRLQDESANWRVMYRIDPDAILVIDVFSKKTQATPKSVIEACQKRLKAYDDGAKP